MEVTVKIIEPEKTQELESLGATLYGYLMANAHIDDPRTAAEICRALRIGTDSTVQAVVHYLRGHRTAPIGARCARPYGYFVAQNRAELQETEANMSSRAMSILFALQGLRRAFPDAVQGVLAL